MSRTVFAQKFKKRVGMTSMEYLTRWRMLLAGDRLKSSDDSVSAISSSLGYETESAFGRAFRRVWGCSPREHRRPEARALSALATSAGEQCEVRSLYRLLSAESSVRELSPAKISTHNPTHKIRCLVRLTRLLAVPACLLSRCNT